MISKHIEKKLTPIQDDDFVSEVARFLSTDLMLNYILPFFVKDQKIVFNAMKRAFDKFYGDNSLFVMNMVKNYILEYVKKL